MGLERTVTLQKIHGGVHSVIIGDVAEWGPTESTQLAPHFSAQ